MWRPTLPAIAALFLALVLGSTGVAEANQVGVLRCNVSPSIGLIITSSRALSCRFSRSHRPAEFYYGTITNFGLDLGATGPGRLLWAVYAATPEIGRFALAGHYGGASADVSFGPGFGANALIGGNAHSIGLQPVSVNAQIGVDVTAGITGLTLEPAPRDLY